MESWTQPLSTTTTAFEDVCASRVLSTAMRGSTVAHGEGGSTWGQSHPYTHSRGVAANPSGLWKEGDQRRWRGVIPLPEVNRRPRFKSGRESSGYFDAEGSWCRGLYE